MCSSLFRYNRHSGCRSLKMTHYVMTYDVIGHDVTILSDIGNETARSKVFVGDVSWPWPNWFRIYRPFFPPQFPLEKDEIWKNPLKSQERADGGTLKTFYVFKVNQRSFSYVSFSTNDMKLYDGTSGWNFYWIFYGTLNYEIEMLKCFANKTNWFWGATLFDIRESGSDSESFPVKRSFPLCSQLIFCYAFFIKFIFDRILKKKV